MRVAVPAQRFLMPTEAHHAGAYSLSDRPSLTMLPNDELTLVIEKLQQPRDVGVAIVALGLRARQLQFLPSFMERKRTRTRFASSRLLNGPSSPGLTIPATSSNRRRDAD